MCPMFGDKHYPKIVKYGNIRFESQWVQEVLFYYAYLSIYNMAIFSQGVILLFLNLGVTSA